MSIFVEKDRGGGMMLLKGGGAIDCENIDLID